GTGPVALVIRSGRDPGGAGAVLAVEERPAPRAARRRRGGARAVAATPGGLEGAHAVRGRVRGRARHVRPAVVDAGREAGRDERAHLRARTPTAEGRLAAAD